jgi:hypothetical protein
MRKFTPKEVEYLKQWQGSVLEDGDLEKIGLPTNVEVYGETVSFYFGQIVVKRSITDVNKALGEEVTERAKKVYIRLRYMGVPFLTTSKDNYDTLTNLRNRRLFPPEIYRAFSTCRSVDIDELFATVKTLDDVTKIEERVQDIGSGKYHRQSATEIMLVPMFVNGKEILSLKEKLTVKWKQLKENFEKGLLPHYKSMDDIVKSDMESLRDLKNRLDLDFLTIMPTLPEIPQLPFTDPRVVERLKKDVPLIHRRDRETKV